MDPKKPDDVDESTTTLVDLQAPDLSDSAGAEDGAGPPAVFVDIGTEDEPQRFEKAFRIGRSEGCEMQVAAEGVSRIHCEVVLSEGAWLVRDCGSTNGTWLDGLRIETAPLQARNALRLGRTGPVVWLTLEGTPEISSAGADLEPYLERYVEGGDSRAVGGHTRMVRKAVDVTRRRQRRRHLTVLSAVVAVALVALTLTWRWRAAQVEAAKQTAADIFYSMKELELQLAELEYRLGETAADSPQLESGRDRLGALE